MTMIPSSAILITPLRSEYIAPIATIKSGMAKYIVCCTTKYATFMTVPPSLHDLFLIFSLPFSLFSSEIYKSYF